MKMNGLKAFVAVNVVSTVTHRSHAFSPSSLSFLAKSRNQKTSSFDHLLPWNAHDKKHTQEKGVDPKNTIDPRASKESVLSTIEKETELRNKCIAFGLQAKNGLSGKNVTVAWSEYTNLTGSWWLNDTMSLEKVVHDFNKSVLTNSSSSSSSSPSESSSISIDNRPAVQENGRKQLVMKIIDAFIRAKKVENRLFIVHTEDENFFFRSTLDKEKRVFLSKEGDEISTDIIEYVQSKGLNDGEEACLLKNHDEVSSWLTKVLGADWKSPQEQKKDLLAELEKAFEKDNIGFFDYIPHLVDVEYPGGLKDFQFETVRERSSCLCVAGESGAGKTSFVQNHVRQNVLMDDKKFDAALYIALDKDSTNGFFDKDSTNGFNTTHSRSEEETKLYTIIQDTRDLIDKNGTAIDDYLGNLQTDLFESRDMSAMECLNKLIKDVVYGDPLSTYKGEKLNSLMLIIDETGYNLEFTRALISQSRRLHTLPILEKVTTAVRLVLCGTGLDLVEKEQGSNGIGSDPSKYTMIKMNGVNQETLADVFEKKEDRHLLYNWIVQDGMKEGGNYTKLDPRLNASIACTKESWRARNLATNARMLRYGIIPCLCNEYSSGYFDVLYEGTQMEEKLKEHLLDPSKDSFLYSYPVRRYMSLNGMNDFSVKERNERLNTAFDYLHAHYLALLDEDERKFDGQFEMIERAKNATIHIEEKNSPCHNGNSSSFDECVTMGLCTRNPKLTSSAMKYLICKGNTFPFAPSEGLAFEKLVAQHLVRFYESKGEKVSLHMLRKQIPDRSITEFIGTENIKKEWETMKETESNVYVILQPMENNAQGPDIMVLRNGSNGKKDQMTLDMYQVKHYKDISNVDSNQVLKSLFLMDTKNKKGSVTRTKETNIEMLLEGFGGAVIGKRYLQASCKFSDFFKETNELKASFKNITKDSNKECVLLSKEWLEPTYSLGSI